MINNILQTSLRSVIGFIVLISLICIIGKKQMGQLTIFTYITGIVMGSIAGGMLIDERIPIADGITGLITWSALTILVEYISLKLPKVRVLLDGEPTIVIKKGEIMQDKLRKQRLNMDDLTMLLRTNNTFSITEVEYAILEPNGQLSILKKANKEQVIKEDLNIQTKNTLYIPTEIIVDGILVEKNLIETGLNKLWLDNQLKNAGINSIKDVFYAELQWDGSLYISKKNTNKLFR